MLSRRSFVKAGAAVSIASAAHIRPSFSANWPAREIRVVCGVPPGAGMDIVVRFYAKKLSEVSNAAVIVENKPGATGNIATETVARAKPDGYTLYICPGSSVFAAAPSLFKKLPFDPLNDFDHITTLTRGPFLLCVAADSPYKTVADLVAALKAQGDNGSYGTTANLAVVASALFNRQFGLNAVEVRYNGMLQALNDLWAKNIAFIFIDPAAAMPQINAGRVRPLATTAATRMQAMPDIPSARDVGMTSTNLFAWISVAAPKGLPREVLEQLTQWFNKIVDADDVRAFLKGQGTDPFPGNPESVNQLLKAEIEAWKEYVKIARIEPV